MKTSAHIKKSIAKSILNACTSGAAMILFLGTCSSARAIKIDWHPDMYFKPGDGVDFKNLQQPLPSPAVISSNPSTVQNGEATETVTFAQHTYDLVQSLRVNTSASLSSLVFNGSIDV